jgi:hypothetical protein
MKRPNIVAVVLSLGAVSLIGLVVLLVVLAFTVRTYLLHGP